jgi:hypothetical protein
MRWNWRHWWWKVRTTGPGVLMAFFFLALLGVALYSFFLDYTDCLQDHKPYECRAMLMSGNGSGAWLITHNH